MFWGKTDVNELRLQNERLRQDRDDAWETANNLQQQVNDATRAMERMQLPHTEEGLEEIALTTARRIEDLFVHCPGGRDHRLMMLKGILREVLRANMTGTTYWKGPGEPNYNIKPRTEGYQPQRQGDPSNPPSGGASIKRPIE